MKLIVTLFWALIIGQVVGYVMTALSGVPDPEVWISLVSLCFGLVVYLITFITIDKSQEKTATKS